MVRIEEKDSYRTFMISIGMVVTIMLAGIYYFMIVQSREMVLEQNLLRARVLYNNILLTRKWNAQYGGLYVEKRKGVESNPYLDHPDVRTVDGRVLTKKNPALMTRELSEHAEQQGEFKFHITSLKLLNPNNRPDEFERQALHQFETQGLREVFRTEKMNNKTYFRYMAPLMTDTECLKCHEKQGYVVGDVRGGISVSFDIEDLLLKLKNRTVFLAFLGLTTILLLLGLISYFMARLIRQLENARSLIEKIAITDELTGLNNRRYILSRFAEEFEQSRRLGKELCCIMADIDHFKAINDSKGHLAGDEVLKEIASRIKQSVRVYDIVGRYGGEEFLILLPSANIEQAWNFAERTRMKVRETMIMDIQVTISMGVTAQQEGDQMIDDMIKRADESLYKAKRAGRDRVEWAVPEANGNSGADGTA